jgi:hypothetical protein
MTAKGSSCEEQADEEPAPWDVEIIVFGHSKAAACGIFGIHRQAWYSNEEWSEGIAGAVRLPEVESSAPLGDSRLEVDL